MIEHEHHAFSIEQVVRRSGIGRTSIFQEIKAGKLLARKCGRRTVVLRDDFCNWLRSMPQREPSTSITEHIGQDTVAQRVNEKVSAK